MKEAVAFPVEGTGLQRYSACFDCAEINSSFHRSHRPGTYAAWAEATPPGFRFSVKIPKTVTHLQRLVDATALVEGFCSEISPLGDKASILLVQLPPSLAFDPAAVERFFADLRPRTGARLVCEPRHTSWFEDSADALLARLKVARVAADPPRTEAGGRPGGWRGLSYFRLHGSPVPYRSSYEEERLKAYAGALRSDLGEGREVWCIFDNTASSAAAGNALSLKAMLGSG